MWPRAPRSSSRPARGGSPPTLENFRVAWRRRPPPTGARSIRGVATRPAAARPQRLGPQRFWDSPRRRAPAAAAAAPRRARLRDIVGIGAGPDPGHGRAVEPIGEVVVPRDLPQRPVRAEAHVGIVVGEAVEERLPNFLVAREAEREAGDGAVAVVVLGETLAERLDHFRSLVFGAMRIAISSSGTSPAKS